MPTSVALSELDFLCFKFKMVSAKIKLVEAVELTWGNVLYRASINCVSFISSLEPLACMIYWGCYLSPQTLDWAASFHNQCIYVVGSNCVAGFRPGLIFAIGPEIASLLQVVMAVRCSTLVNNGIINVISTAELMGYASQFFYTHPSS